MEIKFQSHTSSFLGLIFLKERTHKSKTFRAAPLPLLPPLLLLLLQLPLCVYNLSVPIRVSYKVIFSVRVRFHLVQSRLASGFGFLREVGRR
jgi:hypothetical protein